MATFCTECGVELLGGEAVTEDPIGSQEYHHSDCHEYEGSEPVGRTFRPEDYRQPEDPDDTASIQRALNAADEWKRTHPPR